MQSTDVSGVMTADPRIVPEAVPVRHLSYLEALELAVYGSRLFHPRTFFPLMETRVPMLIRNTVDLDAPGTLISAHSPSPSAWNVPTDGGASAAPSSPTCVTSLEKLALLLLCSFQESSRSECTDLTYSTPTNLVSN